jgi:HK97 family phage prohead protease
MQSPRKLLPRARPRPTTYLKQYQITGYATLFDTRTSHPKGPHTLFRPGAFSRSLAEADVGMRTIIMGVGHRGDYGRTGENLTLWEDSIGLGFSLVPRDDAGGRFLVEELRRGSFRGCSLRYRWRRNQEGHRVAHGFCPLDELGAVNLEEVTFSRNPCQPETGQYLALFCWDGYQFRRLNPRTGGYAEPLDKALDKPKTDPAAARYQQWLTIRDNPFYF